jgi:hypothetical protein
VDADRSASLGAAPDSPAGGYGRIATASRVCPWRLHVQARRNPEIARKVVTHRRGFLRIFAINCFPSP